jgi:multimeric flavodoxin WrbA
MKIAIIQGSYHKSGATAGLVDQFIAGVKSKNPEAEILHFNLLDKKIEYCSGCNQCTKADGQPVGECSIKDDEMRAIIAACLAADCLVIATPIYEYGPTAILKKWMERSLPLLLPGRFGPPVPRNPRLKQKQGVVLLSSGAPWPFNRLMGITRYPVKILPMLCRFYGCGRVFVLPAGGLEALPKAKERFGRKAFALGERVGR